MKRVRWAAAAWLAMLLVRAPTDLSAQFLPGLGNAVPGEDAVSLGILFGQMDPQTEFRDGGRFDAGTTIGATLGFWLGRFVGVQVSAVGSEHVGLPASDGRSSIVSQRDPKIWTTMIDGMARYPALTEGAVVLAPYVALGGGWKTYEWAFDPQGGPDARGFDLAWSYAAGVEARFGANKRIGLRGEYREVRTPIEHWGEDLTHRDRALTAGLLINF